MKKHLLVDQYLPSECEFKIIRVIEKMDRSPFSSQYGNTSMFSGQAKKRPVSRAQFATALANAQDTNFQSIKKWCNKNCSGTWGFTSVPEYKSGQRDGKYFAEWQYYFCFLDEQDILAIRLLLDLDDVKILPMWPSKSKFTIFVYEDEDK